MATTTGEETREDQEAIDAANERPDGDGPSDEAKSIEEMAEQDQPTPPMQIPLPGTQDTVSAVVGGGKPTSTEVRLLGGSLPVEGQFSKGEVVTLVVEARVGSVEFVDALDEWGTVTKTTRRHKLRMTSVKRQ
jgi:hypothetical protein